MRASIGILALGLLIGSGSAMAGGLMPGLWSFTTSMGGMGGGMSMPNLPPEALARMQAAGMHMNPGGGMTVQRCITPEEAARDTPPINRKDSGCEERNVSHSGGDVSFDLVCTGEMQGSGHAQMSLSPEHFTGDYHFTGSRDGQPMEMNSHIEANYVGPDCQPR